MNRELPDVQAGFRIGRGTKLPTSVQSSKKQESSRKKKKKIYLCFNDYTKDFDCVDHKKIVENS